MKAGVIGYGVQGSAVVSILEKTSDITEIIVIDSSSDKIRRCEKVSDPGKVRAFCELFLTCSRRSFRKVY